MRFVLRGALMLAACLAAAISKADGPDLSIPSEWIEAQKEFGPKNERQGGTVPEDWRYELADGVTCKQINFYSDDTKCGGKIFYPKNFDPAKKYPGVVLGHGTNGLAIGIEKYGNRFAEYGIVALVMDYRGYGFSDGWVMLDEPDTTTDDQRVTEKVARVTIKRTRLLTPKQFEDYRAAISYLQGEPGVDPEKIGVWGSSLSGGTSLAVAGADARVKAVVAQVPSTPGGGGRRGGPARLAGGALDDAIKRAREGQGAERDGGFSFKTKIDAETSSRNRELGTSQLVAGMPTTTAVLFLPSDPDELVGTRGSQSTSAYLKERGNPTEVVIIPGTTHFQAYAGPAFEMTSTLAARWFAHYLKPSN